VRTSEMPVYVETVRRYIPEGLTSSDSRRENLKSQDQVQSFLLQRGIRVPKNHRVMEFRAIKITGLMGKIRLVAEHSKPVQSRK
jgi:hypothetical protein